MKSKAERLIERFPVTDLALAVTYRGDKRERFIKAFVDQFTPKSWRAVRTHAHLIYNAQPMLSGLELAPPEWAAVERRIRSSAGKYNAAANVAVANLLRNLIAKRSFKAYQHPEQFIHLAPGKLVKVGLDYYLVENGEVIFQFFQPRADARVDEHVARTLMSLVHYAYVFGDFENAVVEMADLSAPHRGAEREPRFRRLDAASVMSREELNNEIDNVHLLLQQLMRKGT